jgi:hypothetical protein
MIELIDDSKVTEPPSKPGRIRPGKELQTVVFLCVRLLFQPGRIPSHIDADNKPEE